MTRHIDSLNPRDRPTILVFVAHYLPGFKAGGPIRSIANLVHHLGQEFDFRIVTSDRDAGDTSPFDSVTPNTWQARGNAKVFCASPSFGCHSVIRSAIVNTRPHLIYLNSFFSPSFAIGPLTALHAQAEPHPPIVMAPRGEFSEGALGIKKWKKLPYKLTFRALRLHRKVHWQASSESEARDIERELGPRCGPIHVAPNLPPAVSNHALDLPREGDPKADPLRIVFLSRISPMKNLAWALDVLRRVRVPVELSIYGRISDDAYWSHCRDKIGGLPSNVRARYRGVVPHPEVSSVLAEHDLFFLPTLGENYGHAIHEALSAGLPVLISDQTPWRDLPQKGVGWDLPLDDAEGFATVIEAQANLTVEERCKQRLRARSFAENVSRDDERVALNRALFHRALASGRGGRTGEPR